ncbi:MAG: hypothetical protein ACKVZJ_00035 [Phycisphaerales bacterium]
MRTHEPHTWIHAVITLRGWWLPGDARGFRNREHRIHSSGNYKRRPPIGEHAGLRALNEIRSTRIEPLTVSERRAAGEAMIVKLSSLGSIALAVACAPSHAHTLFSFDGDDAAPTLGKAKQASSHAVARRGGRMWAQGAGIDRVRDREHQLAIFGYIIAHAREGAWVWTFRDPHPSLRSAQRRLR